MEASSSSSQKKYEVFLSFRGEDTRDGFTGHLYNALCQKHINTYKDDENLERGHKISEIMDAIKESKICIIVFSKDFASSPWCLNEVVRILECKRGGNDIIPIFYGIEPSIVRKQEQSYAVSFDKHEQRFKDEMDKVQSWRDALNEVAALSGHDSKNKRPEYKFIDEIVEDILLKLSRCPSTCDYSKRGLIGIENRIEEIEGLLCMDSMDVRTIGLYGMGGIGKTTLALAVFQKLFHHFESYCFLRNVREESEKRGIMKLRKELLSKLFYRDKTIKSLGSTHLQERLCRKKVLIVLDDLEDAISQLNELLPKEYRFGAGSRIIVTTRDAQLLKSRTDKVYEVKRLNDVEALKLFRLHAFENGCDLKRYKTLSKSVAGYADGNPLCLEVLGSSLRSKSVEQWKSALDELQIEPNSKIEKMLRISFDQLGIKDKKGYTPIQDVFLDIACFHDDGVDRKSVERKIHHSGATKKISDLIDKCLIIEDENRLFMHALIRLMGKAIVCDENKEPGKRSRLWKAKDVCHVLERNTGSCTMEGMSLDLSELRKDVKVRSESFSNMHHLRFLRYFHDELAFEDKFNEKLGCSPYNKMNLPSKGIEYLSDELRYFQWDLYPSKYLPSNFSTENLVELVMRGSQVVELPWNEEQPIGNLKKIDLGYCEGLAQIQNLCRAINLQWINIAGCKSLVQVPSWFKNLKKLEHLDLGCCKNLKDGLENLPLNIRVLSLNGTAIESLPSSFGCLLLLRDLDMSDCKKLEDIQNISSSNITTFGLSGTAIKTLPESIWKMSFLQYLNLDDCQNLEKFPEFLGDRMSLHLDRFHISGCTRLKSVPECVWKMPFLKTMYLNDCANLEKLPEISDDYVRTCFKSVVIGGCTRLKSIPESIWKVGTLIWLAVDDCSNLEKLPEILDDRMSSSLRKIDLKHYTRLVQVPSWFKNLNRLGELNLSYCKNLKDGLENLPLNIRVLSLQGTAIEALPSSFGCLLVLEDLSLSHCKNLTDGIENLPSNLRKLYLSGCARLKSIPVHPSDLNLLDASNCASLEAMSSWRDFENCQAVYPGKGIPGKSLHIHLPPNWFPIHDPRFKFASAIVFVLNGSGPNIHILFEFNFKTNMKSDDRLHGYDQTPLTRGSAVYLSI